MSEMWQCSNVQKIDFETARNIIKADKRLIAKKEYDYYALIINAEIISVMGVYDNTRYIKCHCNYTPQNHRKKGYFSHLLREVCKLYKGKEIYADCLEDSKGIYASLGFKEYKQRQFKTFTIYYMKGE